MGGSMWLYIVLKIKCTDFCSIWAWNIHPSYDIFSSSLMLNLLSPICPVQQQWTCSVDVGCIIKLFRLEFLGMAPLKVFSLWARLFPWGVSLFAKARKDQLLMGQRDEGESCSPVLVLELVSGQLRHYYKTSAGLHNSSKPPPLTFNLNSVKLVSITLGQKWELQYLNRPWPFTCKLNSAPPSRNKLQPTAGGWTWMGFLM